MLSRRRRRASCGRTLLLAAFLHRLLLGVIVNRPSHGAPPAVRNPSSLLNIRRERHPPWCYAALALAGALALTACQREDASAPAPRPVVAVAVHPDGGPALASLPGEVQARYSTPLSFRIAGKIVERRVRPGHTGKAGQIVARPDPAHAANNAPSPQRQPAAPRHRR